MPLAPAHPSVVLPLQALGLPLGALVAGAVAPDLPVYLPIGVGYGTTHGWPGVLVAAAFGVGLLALWVVVVRDAVVDLVPALRRRLTVGARPDRRAWLLAPLAVLVGAATHVLWDSATHDWGFLVEHLAALREEYGPAPLYRWLQHTSTVVGTLVVVGYGVVVLRRRPVAQRPSVVRRPALWLAPVPVAALAVGLVAGSIEAGVGAALVALVVVAAGWQVEARRRPGVPAGP